MELLSLQSCCPPSLHSSFTSSSRRKQQIGSIISNPRFSHTTAAAASGSLSSSPNKLFFPFIVNKPSTGLIPSSDKGKVKASNINESTLSSQDDLVFVAGSTGKVGSKTVRELLKLGFRVRAGVRSLQKGETLIQSVREMSKIYSEIQPSVEDRLEIVKCDLEKKAEIRQAIGNASKVICCIGASEKEISDFTAPFRIDYIATKNLVDAANALKVDRFILVTSLGTNKIGFPAAILNLFWGVLLWKRKAEEALLSSGLPYTIVRPGGMERPTDAYKETHNLVLANEDTYFGGQVSNLQIAELIAFMAKNTNVSFCKVVEVIAETTAPKTPMENLLSAIPSQRNDISLSIKESQAVPKSEIQKTQPLSPFIAYDDLKPPTSPSPTAPNTESN
ncbi:Protein TIC 62, chloroplastic [Zostera marina]|uniref:Protein TIC 62, chloroplastic n=1 Tax=Zostera marina TaxID=29655 RepID=A0A0K9PZ50_ZOSMR|nr:Protein TIC 62, chloroplastic [Zostera marina]